MASWTEDGEERADAMCNHHDYVCDEAINWDPKYRQEHKTEEREELLYIDIFWSLLILLTWHDENDILPVIFLPSKL